jgi:hypothetical protein
MADWYYFQGGNQQGPVSDDQLRNLVAAGQLQPHDSVWRQGMANWAPISSVPELMPAAPAPAPHYGAPPAAAASYAPPEQYAHEQRPAAARGAVKKITLWSILLVSGAGLWFINTFLPWWGISLQAPTTEEPTKENREAWKRAEEIARDNKEWYQSNLGLNAYRKVVVAVFSPTDPTTKASSTLLGIHTGTGLFAFILTFLILGGVITSWFVEVVAAWRWIASFVFALFALIILILSMLWLFGSPGASAPPYLRQGNSIGPILELLASLVVLTGAVLDGLDRKSVV